MFKATGFDAHDLKQRLTSGALSPSVSLGTISGKIKLKLNCQFELSSWSANQAIFEPRKTEKRTYFF